MNLKQTLLPFEPGTLIKLNGNAGMEFTSGIVYYDYIKIYPEHGISRRGEISKLKKNFPIMFVSCHELKIARRITFLHKEKLYYALWPINVKNLFIKAA